MPWNPNDPCLLGQEWRPTLEASASMGGDAQIAAMTLHSSVTEDISHIWVYLASVRSATATWEIEIYDRTDVGSDPAVVGQQQTSFLPDADVRKNNAFAWGSFSALGTQTAIYRGIDNFSLVPGIWPNSGQPTVHDEGIFPIFGGGFEATFTFDGVSGFLAADKRITSIVPYCLAKEYFWQDRGAGWTLHPYIVVDGARADADAFRLKPDELRAIAPRFPANPKTRASWKLPDLDFFDTTTTSGFESSLGWRVEATRSSNNLPIIHQGQLIVEWADEKRLATGLLDAPHLGWNRVAIADISGAGPWAKADVTDYMVTMRRVWNVTEDAGDVSLRYLSNIQPFSTTLPDQTSVGVWDYDSVVLAMPSRLPAIVEDHPEIAFGFALLMEVDPGAGTISVDSQPYASTFGDLEPKLNVSEDLSVVDSTHIVKQTFVPSATDDYAFLRFQAMHEANGDDAPLFVKVKTFVGDVQQGNTLQVDVTQLVPPATGWQVLEGALPPPAPSLTIAVTYYLEFTSAGSGWHVNYVSSYAPTSLYGPPAGASAATFGGSTGEVIVNATSYAYADLCAVIATVPDPVEDFTAVASLTNECDDPRVELDWSPTNINDCGGFLQYEVERSFDSGATWERFRTITTELVSFTVDREAKVNQLMQYRIRVRRSDHSPSDWATASATIDTDCCGFWLSTNEADVEATRGDDIGTSGVRSWSPQNHPVLVAYYGRNYRVGYHELEYRGVSFDLKLLLFAGEGATDGTQPTATPGFNSFEQVLTAVLPSLGATYSYVVVRNEKGDLWRAVVDVTNLEEREPQGWYVAEVTVSDTTNEPTNTDVAP